MLQRTLPAGFITPSLPTKTTTLPSSSQWLQARRLPHHRPQEQRAGVASFDLVCHHRANDSVFLYAAVEIGAATPNRREDAAQRRARSR
jgi:hypothetical protein